MTSWPTWSRRLPPFKSTPSANEKVEESYLWIKKEGCVKSTSFFFYVLHRKTLSLSPDKNLLK